MKKTLLLTRLLFAAIITMVMSTAKAQWTPVDTAGFSVGGNTWTHLFFDANDTAYVSFASSGGKVMKFDGNHWIPVGGSSVTTGSVSDIWATTRFGTTLYSYAASSFSSQAAVSVKSGNTWISLGNNISTGAASYTNVAIASDTSIYLSYVDAATSVYVKTLVGTSWNTVGGVPVTTTGASYATMDLGTNDTLYVAYQDAAASQNVTVKKFDGTNWVQVGSSFSAQPLGGAFFLSMDIDNNGVPYVAYMSPYPAGPKICVSKFDGTNWVTVGSASFTGTGAIFTSLAIDKNNTPYVSFQDGANSGKVSVMKFDGTSWVYVGNAGVSAGSSVFTAMAIDANNNPYLGYMETNGGTTVQKFSVCTPSTVAAITASDTSICKGDTITLQANGTLNDAAKWYWYTGSCSGSLIDSGTTITLAPGDTTTYYVHGGGGCVLSTPCNNLTINVDTIAVPTITVSGVMLTSSTAAGYQWYKGNSAVASATAQTYTATSSGWYKVMTSAGNCSSFSDSVYVVPTGIITVNSDDHISIYPTLFTNSINVDFENAFFDLSATVLIIKDNFGRTVYEQKGLEQHNNISLSNLASGMYYGNIVTPIGRFTMKMTKQ